MSLNLLDIFLILPMIYGFYTGYAKGIISQLTGIIGGLIAIIFGIKLSGYLKVFLVDSAYVDPAWGGIVGYIITIIGIIFTLKLAGYIARKGTRWIGLGFLEKIIGAVFGWMKWTLITTVMLFFFIKLNQYFHVIPETTIEASMLYPYFQRCFNILYDLANPIIT